MTRFALILSVFVLGSGLFGCAAMQQDYQNRMCNYDAAFEDGANAARQHAQMNGSMIASNCPVEVRDSIMSGYRAGYVSVPQQRPVVAPLQPAPVIIVNPGQGFQNPTYVPPRGSGSGSNTYNPTAPRGAGAGSMIPSAPSQPQVQQQCVESYGRRVCGYGCKESYGNVRCASNPRHSCMASYGKIYCGLNCREDVGRVVCDEWD